MGRTLLTANDGGHVVELFALAPRLSDSSDRMWFVPDTPQCRSLLEGEEVVWARPAPTRDLWAALVNARSAIGVIRRGHFDTAVSTGSSLAVSVLPLARLAGLRAHYIESATRVAGPSLSGRLLALLPGLRTYTQHDSWHRRGWTFIGSIFDGFEVRTVPGARPLTSAVVSLGTSRKYGFRRLVDRVVSQMPPGADVLWQIGSTDVAGLSLSVRRDVSHEELSARMARADVVVCHAGVGSALSALLVGKVPVLVPRRQAFGEHVDDHQVELAALLGDAGLAVVAEATDLTRADLERAAAMVVTRRDELPPLAI